MVKLPLPVPLRPKQQLLAFCDECSHNKERYFVLGALYFIPKEGEDSAATIANIEQQLTELKSTHGLFDRLKWEKVPARAGKFLDGYKEFIKSFLETAGVYFKCLVIDTHKYRLNNAKRWASDALVGYQKFYCVFLADGLMQRYPNYFYEIVVDGFDGVSYAEFEYMVTGRYVKKVRPQNAMYYCTVKDGDEQNSNLLQLVDLLVGVVGFVWNGGMERDSNRAKARRELVKLIESELKIELGKKTTYSEQKFNIWVFEAG